MRGRRAWRFLSSKSEKKWRVVGAKRFPKAFSTNCFLVAAVSRGLAAVAVRRRATA
jgi:hypothetical protein